MTRLGLMAGAAACAIASGAAAQTAPSPSAAQTPVPTGPAATAPTADATQQGVLVFEPAFFADQRPNTALEMVNRVPGFSVQDGDGSRGFEGSVGNILINGSRPASKNDTGSSVLSRTLASRVQRIEVIRGGAPGIDMQGYSVVVNVITTVESTTQSILQLNANLVNGGRDLFSGSYQFSASSGERTWGVTISDGISFSDGSGVGRVLRVAPNGTVLRDEALRTEAYGGGTGIRGNFASPVFGGKVDLTARVGVNDFHNITEQTAPGTLRYSESVNESKSRELGAVFTRPLADDLTMEGRFIHTGSDFDNTSSSSGQVGGVPTADQVFAAEGTSSETILRGLTRWERSASTTIETGGELAYNMLETNQSFTVDGAPVALPSASVKVEETRGQLFGRGTWRLRSDLTLEGGLRVEGSTISQSGDASQEKSFYFVKPRLQATWTPIPSHQLRFRVEREVGQLNFGDFAASSDLAGETLFGGNVNLEPESRWIAEAIYERRFWGEGIFSIGYRHDEVSNFIDVIPLKNGLSAVGNIGDGTLDRVSLNIVVPADRFGFTGGRFTFRNDWNHTEVTDPTSLQVRSVSNLRKSQPNVGVSQDIASWNIQWGVNVLTRLGNPTYNPDFTNFWRAGGDYFQAFIEYKPTATLSLRAQMTDWDEFVQTRTQFADRITRPVAYVETREVNPRTFWSLQLRKTF
ncbi:MAG TPA: TonB-dependent receptor [Brevundimonas sp.]|uniref:TonB-dependent receptor plug domain-containing protein n=1 Tax=Brevundimonas sp. TaxID=1871086 RepID=UPI002ED9D2F6